MIDSTKIQAFVSISHKTYTVKDISKGGVRLEYNSMVDQPFETELIDVIAKNGDQFLLPQLACETVYDIATLMEGGTFRGGSLRFRGLKFVAPTREQQDGLDKLMEYCFSA